MAKDEHNTAAQHHENAAKSHRAAAEHHGKGRSREGQEAVGVSHSSIRNPPASTASRLILRSQQQK